MHKVVVLLFFGLLSLGKAQAQELQCDVVVNSDQVQLTDRRVFTDLRNAVSTFMNNRRWTNDVYRPEERIRCRMLITITAAESANGPFKAVTQIISNRPVYGTGYETPLLSFIDKSWNFEYSESQPLQFSENAFTSHLASLLTFYAYMIIGLDRDSFGKQGGTPLYDRALLVQNNVTAQNQNSAGWTAFDDTRNRYWLLNNLQDPQIEGFRNALYLYYRQGMDIFIQEPDKARANMMEAIKNIQEVARRKPGAAVLRSFFETKADEIVSVFRGAQPNDKQTVLTALSEIDPTNMTKYQGIMQR
ncbi:DUF4835 family protein [Adhaeribacter aquaticus]|uniref:type IX secretion system protein PorD n=1 Tax=Adhaeribacter aquaticus TaxID=299567 RepID=UPI00040B6841|nr:DUF4835 family protein [Adhaeribacter aquaticus]